MDIPALIERLNDLWAKFERVPTYMQPSHAGVPRDVVLSLLVESAGALTALSASHDEDNDAVYQQMLADIKAGEDGASQAELLRRLRQRLANWETLHNDLAYKDQRIAELSASHEALRVAFDSCNRARQGAEAQVAALTAERDKLEAFLRGLEDGAERPRPEPGT